MTHIKLFVSSSSPVLDTIFFETVNDNGLMTFMI